jgi:hypothetical protein
MRRLGYGTLIILSVIPASLADQKYLRNRLTDKCVSGLLVAASPDQSQRGLTLEDGLHDSSK